MRAKGVAVARAWGATWLARLHVRLRRWLLPKLHCSICPLNKYEYIRMVELFHHRKPYTRDALWGVSSRCMCP